MKAVEEERARCAKIAEDFACMEKSVLYEQRFSGIYCCEEIARRIREQT